jgi:predicted Zn-dependent protease with MMP-like domain
MTLPRKDFENLVSTAIESLPDHFLEKLENVLIAVEPEPRPEDWAGRKLPPGTKLLGIYRGIPLTKRSPFAPYALPDSIIIFQHPIESICRTKAEIVEQVRRTVLHEIGHHFGISDPRLRELGY